MIPRPDRFKFALVINQDTHLGFTSLAQIIGLLENQIPNVDDRVNLMVEVFSGELTKIHDSLGVEFYSIDEYTETFDV